MLLALALISGGIPSAVNAAGVQDDYLDYYYSISYINDFSDWIEKECNDLRRIRDSQAASAVSLELLFTIKLELYKYVTTLILE